MATETSTALWVWVAREGLYFFIYMDSECVSGSCGLQLPEEEDVLSTPPSSAKSASSAKSDSD